MKKLSLDQIASKSVGIIIPSLLFVMAVHGSGFLGAAAITSVLSALGPGGMIIGVITFGTATVLLEAVTKYGIDHVITVLVKGAYKHGETKESLLAAIDRYPVSKELKLKLRYEIEKLEASNAF